MTAKYETVPYADFVKALKAQASAGCALHGRCTER